MAMLGECLAFHLAYGPEMKRLCWNPRESGDDPDVEGLQDAQRVLEMVGAVGEAACREAGVFLETCLDNLEACLSERGVLEVEKKSSRSQIEKHWYNQFILRVKAVPENGLSAWVSLWFASDLRVCPDGALGAVVPSIGVRGGRRGADVARAILGNRVLSQGVGDHDPGTLHLRLIPIRPEPGQKFAVNWEPLVKEVVDAFAAITADDLAALQKTLAAGKRSQEAGEEVVTDDSVAPHGL